MKTMSLLLDTLDIRAEKLGFREAPILKAVGLSDEKVKATDLWIIEVMRNLHGIGIKLSKKYHNY